MGYEQDDRNREIQIGNFSLGWFPGYEVSSIPGDTQDSSPTGALDCRGVFWYTDRLQASCQKTSVTTSPFASKITSLFYSPSLDTVIGTAGTKVYSGMQNAAPTDLTGAVSITANVRWKWVNWHFETDTRVIGFNQTDTPIQYTGVGNFTALAGSPPNGKWPIFFQDALWVFNTVTNPASGYFSAPADPETWDTSPSTGQIYNFDAPVTGVGVLGEVLVVFKENSIGILYGTNNLQLTKVNNFITGVGCTSGYSVRNIKLQGQDALAFHSGSGWWAFTGTQTLTRLSGSISDKYATLSTSGSWNAGKYDQVVSTWWADRNWMVSGIADGSDATNTMHLYQDATRLFDTTQGASIPHWPYDKFGIDVVDTAKVSGRDVIYFADWADSNQVFRLNEQPAASDSNFPYYFTSKVYDLGSSYVLAEANILAQNTGASTSLALYINMDLSVGRGDVGSATLEGDSDLLDSTFILDTSTLGGAAFLNQNIQVTGYGRFLQFTFQYSTNGTQIEVFHAHLVLTSIGLEPNA